MNTDATENFAQTLRDFVAATLASRTIEDGKPFIVLPPGYSTEDIEKYLTLPIRKRGHARFTDLDSLCRYVMEHKTEESRAFAHVSDGTIEVMLDFHGERPAWADHTAGHTPLLSLQWARWQAINGRAQTQAQLVDFLERNIADIAIPPGATVLEIAENLSAHVDARFESKLAVADGKTRVLYEEDVTVSGGKTITTGKVDLPRTLGVRLPILYGGDPVDTQWRLRPSVSNRQLAFTLELPHAADLLQRAFESLRTDFAEETGINPFVGSFNPES